MRTASIAPVVALPALALVAVMTTTDSDRAEIVDVPYRQISNQNSEPRAQSPDRATTATTTEPRR